MKSKRAISLVCALVLGGSLLAGCSDNNAKVEDNSVLDDTQAIVTTEPVETITKDYNRIDGYEKQPEGKVFEAGTHIFMTRYHLHDKSYVESLNGVSITVPKGYTVLDFENYISLGGKIGTQQTYGVDVWYINNEDVFVKPVYNEETRLYDYSQPGTVVEKEQTEELVPSQ